MHALAICSIFALAIILATAKPSTLNVNNQAASGNDYKSECTVNSECANNLACINGACISPCKTYRGFETCGIDAHCNVVSHTPLCFCLEDMTGDPFSHCWPVDVHKEKHPCSLKSCGVNSLCREENGKPICSCLEGYIDDPTVGCRPECLNSNYCPNDLICIDGACKDFCFRSCGTNAQCNIVDHKPMCKCLPGMVGDPSIYCEPIDERKACATDSDCASNKSCKNQTCADLCSGVCGIGARCDVGNHTAMCYCPEGTIGNPFIQCSIAENVCTPSPCGPNSNCMVINEYAVCSCFPGFSGSPPTCKPECIHNSECPDNFSCINNNCRDPCPGVCAVNATCHVIRHIPSCSCRPGEIGDPFDECKSVVGEEKISETNPCSPSSCGINSICRVKNDKAICSCPLNYIGDPKEACRPEKDTQAEGTFKDPDCGDLCAKDAQCRDGFYPECFCPENMIGDPYKECTNAKVCAKDSDCAADQSCINGYCKNPCTHSSGCGAGAECNVVDHAKICNCGKGTRGDPLSTCYPFVVKDTNVCSPSPCGDNASCSVENGKAVCTCTGYFRWLSKANNCYILIY